jgi:hypothetical protein
MTPMRFRLIAVFLIAQMCGAQNPMVTPPAAVPVAPSGVITVAEGTTVALTLVSSVKSKSTKPGDAVRAVVAFPVTVGTQLAIPPGTYVEGVVNAVTARAPKTHMASVQLHFTKLLFANGYSVALNAVNTDAMVILPETESRTTYQVADAADGAPYLGAGFAGEGFGAAGLGGAGQTTPTLPPLPSVGPSPAMVAGIAVGGGVAVLLTALALSHHHGNPDYVLFDNGWQFQMVLQSPLTLDAGQIAAAMGALATH